MTRWKNSLSYNLQILQGHDLDISSSISKVLLLLNPHGYTCGIRLNIFRSLSLSILCEYRALGVSLDYEYKHWGPWSDEKESPLLVKKVTSLSEIFSSRQLMFNM